MYTVEELPDSSTALTPGWTYVPDTGFDPAKAAITPALGRKRRTGDAGGGGGGGDLSARQKIAIIRHLAELDRENHRDVPIPARGSTGGRESRTKSTQNVRRVLQSQKTFRNFLDDEEAFLAQQQPHPSTTSTRISKRTQPSSSSTSSSRKQKQKRPVSAKQEEPTPTPAQTQPQPNQTLPKTPFDTHPLLRSYTPPTPTDRLMQTLLSEPALSYNAARAGPPSTGKAQRHFCAMCGHWGRIRCRNCQVRTCGLECFRLHEDSRCGAFF